MSAAACGCAPCPGRGTDGHRMAHCAECCFGSGVEADIDCPIHGDGEGHWGTGEICPTCEVPVPVDEEFDDEIGFEEQAREVHVTVLSCGHEIVRRLRSHRAVYKAYYRRETGGQS